MRSRIHAGKAQKPTSLLQSKVREAIDDFLEIRRAQNKAIRKKGE